MNVSEAHKTKKVRIEQWKANLSKLHEIENPNFNGFLAIPATMGKTQQEFIAKRLKSAIDQTETE